jgi:cephalosporin hydroxylase
MKSTLAVRTYNTLIGAWSRDSVYKTGWRELDEIKERSRKKTDISDHLVSLFVEAVALRPRLIVELGVRGGESTFVFERVARVCGAKLVSVDIEDCSTASSYEGWIFEKSDDIDFAKRFNSWCAQHLIRPEIDILFIDTTHEFKHTVDEIEQWFPFLSRRSKVFFHDTNARNVYFRKDGSIGRGFNSTRGVIAALEKLFDRPLNEKKCFVDWANGWIIRHVPYCSGLAVLERLPGYSYVEEERY